MQQEEQSVVACIESLYCVFKGYGFADPEPGRYEDIMPQLLKPARTIPLNILERYLTTLVSIYGDDGEYIRHFLPRLCELLYSECSPGHYYSSLNTQFVFGRLRRDKWRTWPENEVHAIERFIRLWWHQIIESNPDSKTLSRERHKPPMYFGDGWAGIYNHPLDFLEDSEFLDDSIEDELRNMWADAIMTKDSLGPVFNLATAYVDIHSIWHSDQSRLDKLGPWFTQPERCEALYEAWLTYQNQEPLGSFFSDAHANAELICLN